MKQVIKTILFYTFLPLVLLKDVVKSSRSVWRKIGLVLLVLCTWLSLWVQFYGSAITFVKYAGYASGILDQLSEVKIKGTSMLPTIQDGSTVTLHSPKKYALKRGDIVSFSNAETAGLNYIKRIVGLPGETVTVKNGQVYINDKQLTERYTYEQNPTYGNTFLTDCDVKKVPTDSYAVFGDNRLVSKDSRMIGFVKKDAIEGVYLSKAPDYSAGDAPKVPENNTIDPLKLVKLINKVRTDKKVGSFVTHSLLNTLASKRASQISDTFDSWKKSKSSAEQLLQDQGYRYNLVHEYVTYGYINEEDIINQMLEQPDEADMLVSSRFTEIGVGTAPHTANGCHFPIISVIISWPSIPTYDQATIDHWVSETQITTQTVSNMQSWIGLGRYNDDTLRQIIALRSEQSVISTRIVQKMKNREWLSGKDYADMNHYADLVGQSNDLLDQVFGKNVKGVTTEFSDTEDHSWLYPRKK